MTTRLPKMHFLVFRDDQQLWRWKLVAGNGRVVADSGESYTRKLNCMRMIHKFQTVMRGLDIKTVEIVQ